MRLLKILTIFLLLLFFSAVLLAGYFFNEFYLKRPPGGAAAVSFVIKEGDGAKKIARALKFSGIIKNRLTFESYVWLLGKEKDFQAGEYKILAGDNIHSLVEMMTTITIKRQRLTLIEGWSLRDIADYLKEKGMIKNEKEFYILVGRPLADYRRERIDFFAWDYNFLADKPKYVNLEGYIYPDTYFVLEEDGAEGLIKKTLNNFEKKLTADLRKEIQKQGKTIFEIITLASIVEREVRRLEDKKLVADIFWRRLAAGMPLGADSTINYITASGRTRSTFQDLKIDSPYNTYKYAGLPLGPIANPGIETIRAVIYPTKNNYLYFLTDKDGVPHYARTFFEHTKNRTKYLD